MAIEDDGESTSRMSTAWVPICGSSANPASALDDDGELLVRVGSICYSYSQKADA